MAYKQFILKIDEELFNQFVKACGNNDINLVLTKLIKQFIKDIEKPEHIKEQEFKKYLRKIQT